MLLRRALLLFALVLGLAAVAASVSGPRDEGDEPPAPEPRLAERSPMSEPAAELFFDASSPRTLRLESGRPGTVFVSVAAPGQVQIDDMGLTAAANPLTPARFDVLSYETGRYPIRFTPASGGDSVRAGTLLVVADR